MVEQDTIKLLRECDAGVQMGISSIDDVLGSVRSDGLKRRLSDCKVEHERLDREKAEKEAAEAAALAEAAEAADASDKENE